MILLATTVGILSSSDWLRGVVVPDQEPYWKLLIAAQLSEEEVVVGSAEELKTVSAKKIIWQKDEAKIVQIPYKIYDRIGNPVLFF